MIVDKNDKVNIQEQGFGRKENMSIDENSLQHIMAVLTNLYSDPELAVIREYSTNAHDSHVEAGKTDVPVDVKLPDTFDPIFRIRDYGVGLSENEVYDIYGRYGASTKRNSNDYVGQLGLGCKSALTLNNQFSLIAIKDGIKNTFNIHVDESGIPTISHAHRTNTDEGNGVEVIVPVSNSRTFINKAREFYQFFPVKPNFVGTHLDLPERETYMKFNDKIELVEDLPHNTVVMGGVPYRADELFANRLSYSRLKFLIHADVGEVNFTPSREELHYTKKTQDFLNKVEDFVTRNIRKQIEDSLANCSNYREAHDLYMNMDNQFMAFARKVSPGGRPGGHFDAKFNGIDIPVYFTQRIPVYRMDYNGSFRQESLGDSTNVFRKSQENSLVILSGKSQTFSSTYKSKFKKWVEQNNYKKVPSVIYLAPGESLSDFTTHHKEIFEGVERLDYETDLKPIKLARTATKKVSVKDLEFDTPYFGWRTQFTSEKVDTSKPILMVSRKEAYRIGRGSRAATQTLSDNYNIYIVNKPQRKDFVKTYKPVEAVGEAIKRLVDAQHAKVTDAQIKKLFDKEYRPQQMAMYMRDLNTDDPDLQRLQSLKNNDVQLTQSEEELKTYLTRLRNLSQGYSNLSNHELWNRVERVGKESVKEGEELEQRVLDKYPFLSRFPDETKIKALINSMYHAERKE